MVWTVSWDGDFVVGGDDNRRVTPNFRLKEFRDKAGRVRVHRELGSALQILRTRFEHPLSIVEVDEHGLGALLRGKPMSKLTAAAERAKVNGLFADIAPRDDGVHVVIPNPNERREIDLEQALETAFSVTSAFETSGDRFQQITGNFDKAGLSFGPLQWNFRSGTLVPLFEKFRRADEPTLKACFDDPIDYEEWLQVMQEPAANQIAWADEISTGSRGHDVQEPWKSYFRAVGRQHAFRAIMVEEALRSYGAKLLDQAAYLQSLRPDIEIDHLRCMCALYDLVVQQGSLNKAKKRIEERIARDNPNDQFALVGIAVEERGLTANDPWKPDCVSRRLGILQGVPKLVEDRQRANLHFYMLRDVHIRNARQLMSADVGPQLVRVSDALAAGDTLLA
ncbi:MAG: hypothetical protein AAF543_16775 [Pseudomonadota bacterium]